MLLEQFGYEVVSQTSSVEALEVFRQTPHRFDLAVVDYTMPNMAGQELAQHMLKINANTPIIMCTNVISNPSDVQLKAMGIQAILVKPISLYKLECAIRQVLDLTPSVHT